MSNKLPFHPLMSASSTREDIGILKPSPIDEVNALSAATEDISAIRPDLFPVVDTDGATLQFSDDNLRSSEGIASPEELFGKRFTSKPNIKMTNNSPSRLGFIAIFDRRLGSR